MTVPHQSDWFVSFFSHVIALKGRNARLGMRECIEKKVEEKKDECVCGAICADKQIVAENMDEKNVLACDSIRCEVLGDLDGNFFGKRVCDELGGSKENDSVVEVPPEIFERQCTSVAHDVLNRNIEEPTTQLEILLDDEYDTQKNNEECVHDRENAHLELKNEREYRKYLSLLGEQENVPMDRNYRCPDLGCIQRTKEFGLTIYKNKEIKRTKKKKCFLNFGEEASSLPMHSFSRVHLGTSQSFDQKNEAHTFQEDEAILDQRPFHHKIQKIDCEWQPYLHGDASAIDHRVYGNCNDTSTANQQKCLTLDGPKSSDSRCRSATAEFLVHSLSNDVRVMNFCAQGSKITVTFWSVGKAIDFYRQYSTVHRLRFVSLRKNFNFLFYDDQIWKTMERAERENNFRFNANSDIHSSWAEECASVHQEKFSLNLYEQGRAAHGTEINKAKNMSVIDCHYNGGKERGSHVSEVLHRVARTGNNGDKFCDSADRMFVSGVRCEVTKPGNAAKNGIGRYFNTIQNFSAHDDRKNSGLQFIGSTIPAHHFEERVRYFSSLYNNYTLTDIKKFRCMSRRDQQAIFISECKKIAVGVHTNITAQEMIRGMRTDQITRLIRVLGEDMAYICSTKYGAYSVQALLNAKKLTKESKQNIIASLERNALNLFLHPIGNYTVQKTIDYDPEFLKNFIVQNMSTILSDHLGVKVYKKCIARLNMSKEWISEQESRIDVEMRQRHQDKPNK